MRGGENQIPHSSCINNPFDIHTLTPPRSSSLAREYAASLKKDFTVRYNPYTESVELLDNVAQVKKMTHSIKSDVSLLYSALEKLAD